MRNRVRGLLVASATLLAGLLGSVAVIPTATAAPEGACQVRDLDRQLTAADAVYIGQVKGSARIGDSFDAEVALAWTYSGQPLSPTVTIRTAANLSARSCELGRLTRGETYLFVLTEKRGMYVAEATSGTAPLTPKLRAAARSALGPGEEVGASGPTEPVDVTFTEVGESAASSFWHTALPGFALIGFAVIGLVVLRRLAQP